MDRILTSSDLAYEEKLREKAQAIYDLERYAAYEEGFAIGEAVIKTLKIF